MKHPVLSANSGYKEGQMLKRTRKGKELFRKAGAWTALLAFVLLIVFSPVTLHAEGENNTENGTVTFTEQAIGGKPYRVNVRLTRAVSEDEPPYIVLTDENDYSGSLSVKAGQYTVRATVVERDPEEDIVASVVNASVYVTAGLEQPMTVYVGTVENLKAAGAYLEEGDSGYGKTVTEPDPQEETVEEGRTEQSLSAEGQGSKVDYEELPEREKSVLERLWGFRYLVVSVLVIILAIFGVPKFLRRNTRDDDDDRAIWKD